jgi:hypothetical protein
MVGERAGSSEPCLRLHWRLVRTYGTTFVDERQASWADRATRSGFLLLYAGADHTYSIGMRLDVEVGGADGARARIELLAR